MKSNIVRTEPTQAPDDSTPQPRLIVLQLGTVADEDREDMRFFKFNAEGSTLYFVKAHGPFRTHKRAFDAAEKLCPGGFLIVPLDTDISEWLKN